MDHNEKKKSVVVLGRSLIDVVFSWSIDAVLDTHMYKNKVKQIPITCSSTAEYLSSFTLPLVEETHADMSSSMDTLARSPCRRIQTFKKTKNFKLPRDLFYSIVLKPPVKEDNHGINYEPETGDLFTITALRPRNAKDLEKYAVIAYVQGVKEDGITVSVLLSKPISGDEYEHVSVKSPNLFATYLLNMTTNIRIWQALTCDPKLRNMKVIETVLQTKSIEEEGKCTLCPIEDASSYSDVAFSNRTGWSGLNESQQNAVLSCVGLKKCKHECTVKLVWGPPGTGKTNTVGFMLQSLLAMKRRTLTCAPTNTAIMEVAERLVKRVRETGNPRGYGFGDVVLFGNSKRMKIDERDVIQDIFLDNRIDILIGCFASKNGWTDSLLSAISLLDDPLTQYDSYVQTKAGKRSGDVSERDGEEKPKALSILETMKLKEKKGINGDKKGGQNVDLEMIFEEFLRQRFDHLVSQLSFCIPNLCKHLPTSVISLQVVETMFEAEGALKSFQKLLQKVSVEELRHVFSGDYTGEDRIIFEMRGARMKTISMLKLLPQSFPIPARRKDVFNFFVGNAYLVFCTVSSSAKLHINATSPWELLVIDEAAQLKECESTIPLQLPGIFQAVLIGDERQLPAMVKSKICEEADFGRSLFERLASLGHKKHLLNVQHRMHPSISLFPNKEFYDGQILDGQNVRRRSHNKRFLQGKMFGSYSFINVKYGSEVVENNHSTKNMVEVGVVSEIVASLYKEMKCLKKKVRVGVISPYKAQVYAITESLGTSYSSDPQNDFSVSVRSVDGFQGGEEDVIIISTVRSNIRGVVGFLSNRQRANVALTRARHCLWIVGNGSTLSKSRSVWKKLVDDAKVRRCFHEADEHKGLARAMVTSFAELNQIQSFPNLISLLFRDSMWTVHFDEGFWSSMARVRDSECSKEVLWLIQKLTGGWREPQKGIVSNQIVEHYRVKQRRLIWAIDTENGTLVHTQILKVYAIIEPYEVARLSRQLDEMFGSYSPEKMRRCKYRSTDGDLVVPMTWPADSILEEADSFLSEPLASLSLKNKAQTSLARVKQVEEVSSVGVKVDDKGESSLTEIKRVSRTVSVAVPHGIIRVVEVPQPPVQEARKCVMM